MARSVRNAEKEIDSLKHREARRKHIPTAELETLVSEEEQAPKPIRWKRNTDLDPQLVWRGKDEQNAEDLMVDSVPIYIQEKIQPEAIIRDLFRRSEAVRREREERERFSIPDLFRDFNGLSEAGTEFVFYRHDKNWSNRMILGDSLLVMTSLAEKEALKGQVQCIYMDPPYGIRFNSNWQPSTKSREVKDGQAESLTREPEMIRAFRDTLKDGVHSYLSYLRDRLTVARDLITDTGSIFVQIGDENLHHVRELIDEIFGYKNFVSLIPFQTTSLQTARAIGSVADFLLWYCKDAEQLKYRQLFMAKDPRATGGWGLNYLEEPNGVRRPLTTEERRAKQVVPKGARLYRLDNLTSQGATPSGTVPFEFSGKAYEPGKRSHWKTILRGMCALMKAQRVQEALNSIQYVRFFDDFSVQPLTNVWTDTTQAGFVDSKLYVVQTLASVVERCILMATDPGDLVLDPTCGSGTTAYLAEQWGRRWITIDTSRVALALARERLMAARYPSYLLQDSPAGSEKDAELARKPSKRGPFSNSVRQGFVYERVPHIQLGDIARNAEIDIIWDKWQATLGPLLDRLNEALDEAWEEWEVPRDAGGNWPTEARELQSLWWETRRERQKEIDASIARNADIEYLVDRPYEDKGKVRVAGAFTIESLSPHRVLSAEEENAQLAEEAAAEGGRRCRRAPVPPDAKRLAEPRMTSSASCSTICSRLGCRTPRRVRSSSSQS